MDSTRDEENEYSSIDYIYLGVDRESINSASRRNSEGNTYKEPSSAVKKREQKMFERGETLPLVKKEEEIQNSNRLNQESTICSIKCGLLILFILLTSALSLLFCLHYLDTQKEAMLNEEVHKLKNNVLSLLKKTNDNTESIAEQKKVIDRHETDITKLKDNSTELQRTIDDQKSQMKLQAADISKLTNNASILMDTINSQNKTISEKEAAVQRHLEELTQVKSNASELSKKVDEQKGVIDRQSGEIKKLGDNSAALLKKTNDDAKTIDGLNEPIKKLQQTRMDVLNKTLNGTVSRELATDHSELVNPYMLIFGRYKDGIRVLNPEEDKLIECKLNLPSKVRGYGAAIINNELYIFGGDNGSSIYATNKCFKLDKSHKWIEVASMKENKTTITKCSVVFNSEIWVFGGWTNTLHRLKTVEKYNPEANTWTYMREMIEERSWCAASIIDGKIYVSGGIKKSIEVYDPVKNEWQIFSNNMPHDGYLHSAVVDESSLIIIGGFQNKTFLDEVWKIDVKDPKKEWKKIPSLNQKRWHFGAAKLKNKIIVIGEKPGIEVFDGNKWTIRSSRNLGEIGSIVLLTKQSEVDLLKNVCF